MGRIKAPKYNVYLVNINYLGEEYNKVLIATFYNENRAKEYVKEEQKALKEEYYKIYFEEC